jgi:hypothetical protein
MLQQQEPSMRHICLLFAVLLAGCAGPTPAELDARLSGYVGLSEAQLVGRLGVPTARDTAGDHTTLAYSRGYQEWVQASPFNQDPPELLGLDYNGMPPRLLTWSCETRFSLVAGRVTAAHQQGNYCGGTV